MTHYYYHNHHHNHHYHLVNDKVKKKMLDSASEQKHIIFGFLSLANFTEHDDLQFHPFSFKQHNFILLYSWVILPCVYIVHFLYPFIIYWSPKEGKGREKERRKKERKKEEKKGRKKGRKEEKERKKKKERERKKTQKEYVWYFLA
jgi:hypothetical protein